ncbi:MAG TPA: MBL fold metallo-hydrolase, partial [Paraburkholderia sp.]|nr:MBL fold metallo-hydrolase [Paraburkholderia sp.]
RVAWLRADPTRNARNALKVLIVFKLLETRTMSFDALLRMLDEASVLGAAASVLAPRDKWPALLAELIEGLAKSGALKVDGTRIAAPAA